MSESVYGQCPYCHGNLTQDHKCWQRSAIVSLKGQFNDPDLLRAEIERLTAELERLTAELERLTAELDQARAELRAMR